MMRTGRPQAQGFTLIEVLVALAIVAIALLAGSQATGALLRNASRQSDLLLAQLCAENALAAVRLSGQLPAIGDNSEQCPQGSETLELRLTVRPTPNPNFRRVDAQVLNPAGAILRISTIAGRR